MTKRGQSQQSPNVEDLVSQSEAARLRGVTKAAINNLIKRGRLQTVEVAGRPLLYRHEVETFEPEAGGRGKKAPTIGPRRG